MDCTLLLYAALLLSGCSQRASAVSCPDDAAVAPESIGGASAVKALTPLLNSPNRENTIAEAATRFRKQDPGISTNTIINIMIAADCPNLIADGVPDVQSERARISAIRSQVERIIAR